MAAKAETTWNTREDEHTASGCMNRESKKNDEHGTLPPRHEGVIFKSKYV